MVVKEGSVFSLQIWGRVSSSQTQGKGVKLPLFLIMYVLKYFFPIFPNFNVAGFRKYLLQCFSKNQD